MRRSVRTTISLPAEQYRDIVRIARDQHVSTAWVLRDALRDYLAAQYPLFEPHRGADRVGAAAKKKKS